MAKRKRPSRPNSRTRRDRKENERRSSQHKAYGKGKTRRSRAKGRSTTRDLRDVERKKRKPLWTLEEGITQSLLARFMECPEQAALNYIDGYATRSISVPLDFGSIMHYAIEHQYDPKYRGNPEACIYDITHRYRIWREPTLTYANEKKTLEQLLGLAEVTFPAYCRFWQEDDSRINWIEREVKFDVPYDVQMPAENVGFGLEGQLIRVRLRGMRDGLYRNPKRKVFGVFETKNRSRIDDSDIRNQLRADLQTLWYVWVTYLERGELPTEIMYNIIRRSNMYQRKDEDHKAYLARIAEDIQKNPEEYFFRYQVTLVPNDLRLFVERTIQPLLIQFIRWWHSLKKNPTYPERWTAGTPSSCHYQNLCALTGKYGKADMYGLIVEPRTSKHKYRLKTEPFPELSDSLVALP